MPWEWIALAVFFGVWIGVSRFGINQNCSVINRVGGGFIVACLSIPVGASLKERLFENEADLPSSLSQAGLSGKKWDATSTKEAAKITVNQLSVIKSVVDDADRRGDYAAAVQAFDPLISLMQDWNAQDSVKLGEFKNCLLATVHLSDAAMLVSKGGRFSSDRYDAALSSCKRAGR